VSPSRRDFRIAARSGADLKYRAFINDSHKENTCAHWPHKALEAP
jgi:hypothetical protein